LRLREVLRQSMMLICHGARWSAVQEMDAKVRTLRDTVKQAKKDYDKTEDDLKALQSVGQIIGEVLRQLDDERCACPSTARLVGSLLAQWGVRR
jgi:ATP-dependent 26S proteasome regulatory subunit